MKINHIEPRILRAATVLLQESCPELSPVTLVEALKKYTPGKREWLTVADAATRLHVTEKTVGNWMRDGMLRGHKIGGRILISTEDLEAVIQPLDIQGGKDPSNDVQG